ncbi:hypothetical protein Bbelb_338000 [Branchiostoma belcheri]|nr:hypothetical protein Bbelb_338000 [Branchiostoma belcheri]
MSPENEGDEAETCNDITQNEACGIRVKRRLTTFFTFFSPIEHDRNIVSGPPSALLSTQSTGIYSAAGLIAPHTTSINTEALCPHNTDVFFGTEAHVAGQGPSDPPQGYHDPYPSPDRFTVKRDKEARKRRSHEQRPE